jgi:hypothetical protein
MKVTVLVRGVNDEKSLLDLEESGISNWKDSVQESSIPDEKITLEMKMFSWSLAAKIYDSVSDSDEDIYEDSDSDNGGRKVWWLGQWCLRFFGSEKFIAILHQG